MDSIGKVFEKKCEIEWKIDDFFSYTENDRKCRSPNFHVCNLIWYLLIRPKHKLNNEGYVSLYLHVIKVNKPLTIDFKFGIKTVDKTVANQMNAYWNPKDEKGYGWDEFIKISDLQLKKSEMVPLGTLTIICHVKVKNIAPDLDTRLYKLATDLKDMFISKTNTDITIKVKDETFSAHKFCLAARSPVLAAMFENEMTEKRTGLINIPDCDPKAFNTFLLYLYFGDVNCAECDVFELYKIADKYDVSELKLLCIDFMIQSLCVENFCETYVLGHQFDENELLTNVQSYFEKNFEKIFSSDVWVDFLKDNSDLANRLLKAMAPKIKIEE